MPAASARIWHDPTFSQRLLPPRTIGLRNHQNAIVPLLKLSAQEAGHCLELVREVRRPRSAKALGIMALKGQGRMQSIAIILRNTRKNWRA
jgi:hypothetical protein